MSDAQTALARIDERGRELADQLFGEVIGATGGGAVAHNLRDVTPMEQARLLSLAIGSADLTKEDLLNKTIDLRHWVVHRVAVTDERTGETRDAVRTVIITPEGRTASFVSDGVARSLALIVQVLGPGPYNPPVRLDVLLRQTRSARHVLLLQISADQPSESRNRSQQ